MATDWGSDPKVKELTAQTDQLLELAEKYVVTTDAEYETAGTELTRVKAQQGKLEELRKSITRPMDAAKKAVMDLFRGPEEKLARAEAGIKRALVGYQEEQDRKRREDQARADEAARKERERIEAQAARAAAAGKVEKAEALQVRASTVVAPVVQRSAPRVAGVQLRDVWKFEVTDESKVPRQYLSVDEGKIRKVVGALRGDSQIEGVRVWCEKAVAAGSGA